MGRKAGEAPFDRWSWVHVASGIGLAVLGLRWYWAVSFLVAFEGLEAVLRRIKPDRKHGLFEYESWPNIAADVAVAIVGYVLATAVGDALGWEGPLAGWSVSGPA